MSANVITASNFKISSELITKACNFIDEYHSTLYITMFYVKYAAISWTNVFPLSLRCVLFPVTSFLFVYTQFHAMLYS